ncbi:ABC transporter permease [Paenibacillus sp. sgz500958]|uniref:ABC transporter permease n=1 Tax=Paenibacillus sp. sgz500958 TaxID=3242475 RepID=UPI0036D3E430
MNKMGTIIGFTFKNKVKTKSFMVITLILVVLLSIGMNIPYMIKMFQGDDGGENAGVHLAVVAQSGNQASELLKSYVSRVQPASEITVDQYTSADDSKLQQDIKDGKVDGYVEFGTDSDPGLSSVTFYSQDGKLEGEVQSFLQIALQQVNAQLIAGNKLTPEQISAMNTPVMIDTKQISTDGTGGAEEEKDTPIINYVIVYVLLMLFFMSIMMTGNMIAAEVTSEKSSRIMEILITSASPLAQMFGKVLGIFMVGLLQIVIIAATVAANLTLPHNASILTDNDLDLGQMNVSLLTLGLVLYILGYFLYALMYAAVGSIVSRTEDLGQAVMPIMMLAFAAFYIPLFSISSPDTLLVKIASYVPFTAPLTLLLRIGVGEIAPWEIIMSLVILLVTILGMGWLAAKIYRTGVLMYGKRPTIKEIRKAMKAYKI